MLKYLFLIDGAAGTGKTDLVTYISEKYQPNGYATYIQKFTTREQRVDEVRRETELDLEFVSDAEFEARQRKEKCYTYIYGDERYGFEKRKLDTALRTFECVFVIVRSLVLIQELLRAYSNVQIVTVYVHADGLEVKRRLEADGYDKADIGFRLRRQSLVWNDYLKHSDAYDEVIINNAAQTDFQRVIDGLVRKYTAPPHDILPVAPGERTRLPRALVGSRDDMLARLRVRPYERNVFLMMKFRSKNEDVFEFIASSLQQRGFECVRADQPEWNITADVYNPVAVLHCCKYGIALFDEAEELNSFSPNVAYELGMMHLQRKRCLILRHTSLPPMPFDLIKDLHKPYTKDLELRRLVERWLNEIASEQ